MGLNVERKIINFLETNIGEKYLKVWVKQDFFFFFIIRQKFNENWYVIIQRAK